MKPGTNGRRPRGRPNRKQHGGHSRPNNFDSSGPEGRVRGNAHQVYERYIAMARDAVSASDRVAAETYYQYAEHYFRVLNASTDPQQNGQAQPDRQGGDNRQNDGRQNDGRQNDGRQNDGRRNDNRQDRGRQDGRRANEAQNRDPAGNGEQPIIPAANSQDAPSPTPQQQPAEIEAQRRQPRRKAPADKIASTNGAAPAPEKAEVQPEPKPDGDSKTASVQPALTND